MYNAYNTKLVKKYSYFYFSCEVTPTHWTRTQVNKTNARCADRWAKKSMETHWRAHEKNAYM